jgi:hypothetical protein
MLLTFPNRMTWSQHELTEHRIFKSWTCHLCPATFSADATIIEHLQRKHDLPQHHCTILAATSLMKATESGAVTDRQCPLCMQKGWSTSRRFIAHLGRHLEEIALSVLPREIDSDSDQQSDADEVSEDADYVNLGLDRDAGLEPATKKHEQQQERPYSSCNKIERLINSRGCETEVFINPERIDKTEGSNNRNECETEGSINSEGLDKTEGSNNRNECEIEGSVNSEGFDKIEGSNTPEGCETEWPINREESEIEGSVNSEAFDKTEGPNTLEGVERVWPINPRRSDRTDSNFNAEGCDETVAYVNTGGGVYQSGCGDLYRQSPHCNRDNSQPSTYLEDHWTHFEVRNLDVSPTPSNAAQQYATLHQQYSPVESPSIPGSLHPEDLRQNASFYSYPHGGEHPVSDYGDSCTRRDVPASHPYSFAHESLDRVRTIPQQE